jgi:peptidoglycan/xylan/chitin deacetylase (PgdA/CDA1 family)
VRVAIGRAAVALLLVAAAGYLVLVNDSTTGTSRDVPAPPMIQPPIVDARADTGGRDWRESVTTVVPLGYKALSFPILLYHYIRKPPDKRKDLVGYNLSVSPQDFEAQMDWLLYSGYHPVDFNDIRAYYSGVRPLPAKPVVITFDDGYADLYTTAYPILRARGFKAVAYIVSGFVNHTRYVTSAQILEMDRNGIEIASHTVDHADLTRDPAVAYEVDVSKQWLERLVGHPVIDFAYPSGKYDALAIHELQQAAYSSAVTEMPGTWHTMDDRYVWTRVRVSGGENLIEFVRALGPVMPTIRLTTVNIPSYPLNPEASRPGY